MPRAVFENALAFLRRSGIPEARFLGGEPTEHPSFGEYVELALARGFAVTVFTGGWMAASALAGLRRIAPDRLTVVLNTADPGTDSPVLLEAQHAVCRALGACVELGLTFTTPAPHPDHLLAWIEEHGLRRRIRLGLAHPIWGGANRYLRPQAVRHLGAQLETFAAAAGRAGVELDLDCGFTPCMFSARFLEKHPDLARNVGTRCNPIVDILPEGDVIACYALSRAGRRPLTEQSTHGEIGARFEQDLARRLPTGAYRECAACEYRARGLCGGGCRARQALRLRPDSARLLAEESGTSA